MKQAGFRVIAAIDNDKLAANSYRANHPEVEVVEGDIQDVAVAKLMRDLGLRQGELELLAGCPPCQAFSTLRSLNGKRRIRDGSKDLVLEFMRFVRNMRPKCVMLENVPRLFRDRRLRQVRRELEDDGYKVVCEILDASKYAVPQRRRRMILMASRSGEIGFAPPARCSKNVRDAIGKLGRRKHDPLHRGTGRRSERIRRLLRLIPKNGGSRRSLGKRRQLNCHKECDGFKDIYGRMAWAKLAPTLTGGCINPSKGRFLHPTNNRAITLREAALLQTFPRRYKFSLEKGKYAVARMIGNALPPEFIRRQALQIMKSLRGTPNARRVPNGCQRKRRRAE